MKASALGQHLLAGKLSDDQLAAVPHDCRLREPRDFPISDADRVGELVRQIAQPRSEDQADPGAPLAPAVANGGRRRVDVAQKLHRRAMGKTL
jgi:hypothetical protein